jgi:chemotaxis signal transduction protein
MGDSVDRSEDVAAPVLLVRIEQWRGALPLEAVREVVRAVAVTPLSGRRGPLLGYVDVRGDVCPVVDARRIFGLRGRALRPSDRMVILGVGTDRLIIPVDEAGRVSTVRIAEDVTPEAVAPDPSRESTGLRAARVDEPGGEILALVDPVAVFGHLASGRTPVTPTEGGSAPGP